jgi:hypothetical protein
MIELENRIFEINSEIEFEELALEIFRFQSNQNVVYKEFINKLGRPFPKSIKEIPFLPISFFKNQEIRTNTFKIEQIFKSSGTGGQRSSHFIEKLNLYDTSFELTYRNQLGNPEDQVIIALLPNYVAQGESSLVYMVDKLIKLSNSHLSGYYLENKTEIQSAYQKALSENKKVIVLGVSYALLDLAEADTNLSQAVIIETGGMKGRRKELTKEELHQELIEGLHVPYISSEYGMCELLSQSYSNQNGIFISPPWMKILIREMNDPFGYIEDSKTGGINVIDLANLYSCSFISTQDLGKTSGNQFQLMGRFDNSDVRGCNLLLSENK